MKKIFVGLSFISLCIVLSTSAFAQMPGTNPDEVWKYITEESPYTEWGFWAGHEDMQKGRAPHGPFHKVYVNKQGIDSTQAPAQDGTIQVKESYNKSKELKAITVMYKVKGYNPDAGDWYWVKYSLTGKAEKAGKPKGCIRCHRGKKKNDYVFVHEFK